MTTQSLHLGLPDPVLKPEFYDGILIKRGLAWVIDALIVLLFCIVALPFTAFLAIFVFPLLMVSVGFVYRWITLAGRSSTWGMRMTGIEIRDRDGLRLQSGTALAHVSIYSFSILVAPMQLISVIMMLFTDRRQGLSDLFLGTAALNRPAD
jgi:uncharacterized RDD family membrane protein YckC